MAEHQQCEASSSRSSNESPASTSHLDENGIALVELIDKLRLLADAAKYDASCASSGSRRARPTDGLGNTEGMGICHSYTPDGRCVSLLKLLLTNYCVYDCAYCVNRVSSETPRARFLPDEVVTLTLPLRICGWLTMPRSSTRLA